MLKWVVQEASTRKRPLHAGGGRGGGGGGGGGGA